MEGNLDENTAVSTTVVEAMAKASDTTIEEVPLLHAVVDPNALDRLCSAPSHDDRVTFQYQTEIDPGYSVVKRLNSRV